MRVEFPGYHVDFEFATGRTVTYFGDRWSGCEPVPEDGFHGARLGLTDKQHRFLHEIMHHLVGIAFGYGCSPVIWRDAFGFPQHRPVSPHGPNPMQSPHVAEAPFLTADIEEWIVTNLSYRLCGCDHDIGAVMDVAEFCGGEAPRQIERLADLLLNSCGRATRASVASLESFVIDAEPERPT